MLKAIFAKHVWSGDSILLSGGERVEIDRIEPGTMTFILKGGRRLTLHEYDIVGLGHRPWPERKTEEDMRAPIIFFANLVCALHRTELTASLDKAASDLREAIEDYELGKPLESDK